jgi:hypothetical protein
MRDFVLLFIASSHCLCLHVFFIAWSCCFMTQRVVFRVFKFEYLRIFDNEFEKRLKLA